MISEDDFNLDKYGTANAPGQGVGKFIDPVGQLSLFEPEEITRPELNIAKWANHIFASPYLKKGLFEERSKTFVTTWGDQQVEASISITPHHKLKTLTTTSYKVFLALVQIWENQGKPANSEIVFSGRQIASLLGWTYGGTTAERIREQLEILSRTGISWKRAFKGADGKVMNQVEKMSILGDGSYFEAKDRLSDEKYESLHRVMFGRYVLNNLVQGITKPINYHAYISIENEAAANLYTQIDIYLSGQNRFWERRATALLYEDLGMTGKRYEQKKHRLAKLKELVAAIDGKELSSGKLKATYKPTADGTDYKLVTQRIPRIIKSRRPPKLANPSKEIPLLVEDIIEGLTSLPGGSEKNPPNPATIKKLAMWYSRNFLMDTLQEIRADYRGRITHSPTHIYMSELRRKAKEANMPWITDGQKK